MPTKGGPKAATARPSKATAITGSMAPPGTTSGVTLNLPHQQPHQHTGTFTGPTRPPEPVGTETGINAMPTSATFQRTKGRDAVGRLDSTDPTMIPTPGSPAVYAATATKSSKARRTHHQPPHPHPATMTSNRTALQPTASMSKGDGYAPAAIARDTTRQSAVSPPPSSSVSPTARTVKDTTPK